MGALPREAPRLQDGGLPQRTQTLAHSLETPSGGAVHTAVKRSPRSRGGTTITRSGGHMAAVTQQTIGCCCTRPATAKSIMPGFDVCSRTRSHGCSERLEPDIGKLICPVLRGGGGGNVASLPDTMQLTVLGQYGKGLVQCEAELGKQICDQIERLKWSLWHRQVDKVLAKIHDLQTSVAQFIRACIWFKLVYM